MQETYKEFTFEAAHQTPPYSGLHGHTFVVGIVLTGEPHPVYGWTHNLGEVEPVVEEVRQQVDHKYLNDIPGLEVPSLENVARWLWARLDERLPGLDRVSIRRGASGHVEGVTYSGRR